MSGSQVTVLCPNGRRVVVKTTPGLCILQIIENACEKQKLDPDLYGIRLLRRVLDPSSNIRFSNVPNNAQLELFLAPTPRQAGLVTISLATESGQRLVAEFPSSAMLMDVLKYHEQKGGLLLPPEGCGQVPVIVYTMERLSGEKLRHTMLKTLGIVKGSYMLRYLVQDADSSGSLQLCGSGSLSKAKAHIEEPTKGSTSGVFPRPQEPTSNSDMECALPDSSTEARSLPPVGNLQERFQPLPPVSLGQSPVSNLDIVRSANMADVPDVLRSDKIQSSPDVLKLTSDLPSQESLDYRPNFDLASSNIGGNSNDLIPKNFDDAQTNQEGAAAALCKEDLPADLACPLGSNNALLFSLDDAPTTLSCEEDDSFFTLSFQEVQKLYREQSKILKEMEDVPLKTEKIRSLEEEGKLLTAMKNHPVTQLRIVFPDRLVIQAMFKPHNTIEMVKDFLRQFLKYPQDEFYLYALFPKVLLDPSSTLVKANCIPNAKLYFGSNILRERYISDETLLKKSSYAAANNHLRRHRDGPASRSSASGSTFSPQTESKAAPSMAASTSSSSHDSTRQQRVSADPKVPKWFKLSKK